MRRILGIDPGSHHLGIGCIEQRGNELRLVFAESVNAPRQGDFFVRMNHILTKLEGRIEELSPHEVVLEDSFFGKNAKSAFQLGMSRGAVAGPCLRRGLPIFQYAPTQVKVAVTGYGRADKVQVQKMVGLILGVSLDLGFDATDAIAVAICHANRMRTGIPC